MISNYTTTGSLEHLSVKYQNIYIINGIFHYLALKSVDLPYVNKFTNQYPFRPEVKLFESEEQLQEYVRNLQNVEEIDLAAIGDNIWYGNIGHALWDGLYPLYVALVKFGYSESDFVPLFKDFQNRQTLAYEPTVRFAGKDIIDYLRIEDNKVLHLKTLVAGTGSTGNRVINVNYTLYGEKEYKALSLFKNRLLSRYNLQSDKSINNPLKIIVIKNKRFTEKEEAVIRRVVEYYKTKASTVSIKYIDWYHGYSSFENQMKEVVDVDIHITGPGTGMMYMPLLKKGAVNINLGYIEHVQTNSARPNLKIENTSRNDILIPGWMEQSVCAGAEYVNTLYYDRYTYNDLEYSPMIEIIEKGKSLVGTSTRDNLNIDALVFREYCRRSSNSEELCNYLTGIAFFIELFINEHPKTLAGCCVDIELLRQIKKEYNLNTEYTVKL